MVASCSCPRKIHTISGRSAAREPNRAKAHRTKRRLLPFVAFFLLSSTVGLSASSQPLKEKPVPGWPELRIETHYVSRIAMRGNCFPVPPGTPIPETSANGCARPIFSRGICNIFIDFRYVGDAELLEHQQKRCRGHDYVNDDRLADAYRAWLDRREDRYLDTVDFGLLMFLLEGLNSRTGDKEKND